LPYTRDNQVKEDVVKERRNIKRRNVSYYMPVLDDDTLVLVGHMTDISPKGFRVDSKRAIPAGRDFRLRMDMTGAVADKPYITVVARSRWSRVDPLDPFVFNVGFEIVSMSSQDSEIYQRILTKYGSQSS
jgi:hypothetical protein